MSLDRRKLSHNTVIQCRMPFKNVTYSLVGSHCSIEPSDVDEEPQVLPESS